MVIELGVHAYHVIMTCEAAVRKSYHVNVSPGKRRKSKLSVLGDQV